MAFWKDLHDRLKGKRTVIFGALVVAVPELCTALLGLNLNDYVGPHWGPVVGVIIIGLRAATRTPIGVKHDVPVA